KTGLFFGGFQGLMPLAGWFAGAALHSIVTGVDHWVAFLLLSGVGGKMIYEALKGEQKRCDVCRTAPLLMLAIATSIDAFAVGLSLSFLGVSIFFPAAIIGAVTFALSAAGIYIGCKAGHFFENKIEIAGGAVLVALGLKILLEHLSGA
ncbi:MAG TPA: manganese efflux pump MntP family protein, partial [Elusimicrobiales bacterium]|nr:manganese efflux pump MntP family protein [Elusimicrobiales bacterium]